MTTISIHKVYILLAVILAFCLSARGQKTTTNKPSGVIKRQGWVISHLKDLRVEERVPLVTVDSDGKHNLYITNLAVRGDGMLLWDVGYFLYENGKRRLHDAPISVSSIKRIDFDGKVFCYIAYGTGVSLLKHKGGESPFIFEGCEIGYAYYDLDGDGKFELLSRSNPPSMAEIYIPSWVISGAATRSNNSFNPKPR